MRQVNKPQVVQFTPRVFGFPDRILTKLRYSDFGTVSSTTGAVGSYKFRWNSTFDPDYTGTGHQPLYRDTYAAIYDQYAVVRARVVFRITNPSTTAPIYVTLNTDDDSTFSSTAQTLAEQSRGISTTLTPLSGSRSFATLSSTWSAMSVLNIDPFSSETYKTAVGSNPTEESYFALSIATQDASTASVNWQVMLEQEVLWTELSTPTQS
jgi:hypothetical protein